MCVCVLVCTEYVGGRFVVGDVLQLREGEREGAFDSLHFTPVQVRGGIEGSRWVGGCRSNELGSSLLFCASLNEGETTRTGGDSTMAICTTHAAAAQCMQDGNETGLEKRLTAARHSTKYLIFSKMAGDRFAMAGKP